LSVRYRVQGWRGAKEDGRLNTYEHVAEYFEYLIRGILDIINNPSTATDLDADVRRRKALELLPSILEQYHKFLQLYLERTHRFPQVPDDIRKPLQEWERQHSPDPDAPANCQTRTYRNIPPVLKAKCLGAFRRREAVG
jgi:hypothetical protein